ncbi:hypothetical protein A2W14_02540 [Candidatus Gottesmanbacteria bacterium RBG_16_37_8]|uniref:Antitoxin n=1 Tax=Candidatus Gottesmanbacteria bacterium RBG_16_37_8 TaxID=1798371 RepID=A0A1F5YQG2_9BACT|nr:MAG: hypothetical protein A2W14_02540 [Candidatus Gottesmanbacteria bacterium RBG_16_37_8]
MKRNIKNNPLKDIILDKFEQSVEAALERGEFESAPNLKEKKKMFAEAVIAYKDLNITKRITLRVKHEDLIKVKIKAKKNRIPYQTLISAIIHQFAEGKTNLVI